MWFAGNDVIHQLTKRAGKRQVLRIDLKDTKGNTAYALYDNFAVAEEIKKYKLESLGNYTGTAGRCDMITYKGHLGFHILTRKFYKCIAVDKSTVLLR